MNVQQLNYVLALAETRHFETAAEKCFIAQSTLSTMILKLEDELGISIFDRKKKPLVLTSEGQRMVEQMKIIKKEMDRLLEITSELKGEVSGKLALAIIPTVAPYLLPLFLNQFASQFPNLQIHVREHSTDEIIRLLLNREVDIGILSIPLLNKDLIESPLYDEPFLMFDSRGGKRKQVTISQLKSMDLCLLEEGHCMRNQILQLCSMPGKAKGNSLNFNYQAGTIDGLMRFVRSINGVTLLPHLAALDLSKAEKSKLFEFSKPVPHRRIGLVTHRHFVRHTIKGPMIEEILKAVQGLLPRLSERDQQLSPLFE